MIKNKNILLFLTGFIPLGIGFLMNSFINTFEAYALPYGLIGIVFIVMWGSLGFVSSKFQKNIKISFAITHLPIFLALILNLYQDIILEYYMIGIIGRVSQYFYLPILNIAYRLTYWSYNDGVAFITGFIIMCLAYFVGYNIDKKK